MIILSHGQPINPPEPNIPVPRVRNVNGSRLHRQWRQDLNGKWYMHWSISRWGRIREWFSPENMFRRAVENDMEYRNRWH